ncbi:NAD(P)/FAD-dependent oxidoreductase [Poseidonocella sedimentorum]|uniref:Glycine/D-amino acid oxidase n=1 Tax=Poseidonocella sedimentorum TaxID=871652 RepID=A0A1I6D741_9RHOB|nr:FAD-binding oxidoreductase [Poseidonocella sedimentorum]SFR01269.1 Glycine/D-amino acid oxidase [Poseidonocella sedimentorum]
MGRDMVDVTVRGAGIAGLTVAWSCARRGARVRVIDPHGVGAGASGGVVGALAPHVPEMWNVKKAFQFESLILAEGYWREVEAAGGLRTGYGRTGRLQPIADAAALALARQREGTAREHWKDAAVWRVVPAREAGPWAPPSPTGWLIHDTLSARIHPRQTCAALAAALRAHGAEIVETGPDDGAVIYATGWRGLLSETNPEGRALGAGVKGQAALLRLEAIDAPQLFADGLHIVPHHDGTVAIGSTSEREFADPVETDAQLDEILRKAQTLVPTLAEAPVIEQWAGVRPRAKTRAPMLGPVPGRAGAYIANGGFKIGLGMAPKCAEVLADLVLDGRDAIPEGFRPEASF